MSSVREELYRVVTQNSTLMGTDDIHHFVSGILVGLAMAEMDPAVAQRAHGSMKSEWLLDANTVPTYGPDGMAIPLLRALGAELGPPPIEPTG